jgi:hypothetical protein
MLDVQQVARQVKRDNLPTSLERLLRTSRKAVNQKTAMVRALALSDQRTIPSETFSSNCQITQSRDVFGAQGRQAVEFSYESVSRHSPE